ncbi:MAG: hypothetical protein H6732_10475 [Alphaproteobacteria bacterium]|nr:hypothetical protein [Alphaproteobacteria bacterium]
MRAPALAVVAGLIATQLGCAKLFARQWEDIEEACQDRFPGDTLVESEARIYLRRLACYRRFVNLSDLAVTEEVHEATTNHAKYLRENGVLDKEITNLDQVFVENMNLPFATGQTVRERLLRTGAVTKGESFWTWDVWLRSFDPRIADEHADNPFIRDIVFQPGFAGAGIELVQTQSSVDAYMNVLFYLGNSDRIDWPVVYPKDGQSNVKLEWDAGVANPLWGPRITGYPITITLGASKSRQASNPYQARLYDAHIYAVGADGNEREIAYKAVMPQKFSNGSDLLNTIILFPQLPLQSDTEYRVDVTLGWVDWEEFKLESSFRTLRVGGTSTPRDSSDTSQPGDSGDSGGPVDTFD